MADNLPRTVLVFPKDMTGGAERWLLNLLDSADSPVSDAVVLDHGPSALTTELTRRGLTVHRMPVGASGAAVLAGALRLRRLLRHLAPQAVLANGVKAAAVAVPAGRLAGLPTVWAKHDHFHDGRLARVLGRLVTRVVAVSPAVAAATGRADAVLVPPPRPVEPYPVDQARDRLRQLGVDTGPGSAATLAMLTRLIPYKGVDTAIEALARTQGWRLVVFGGADPATPGEGERLRRLAAERGVGDRVQLLGQVEDASRLLSGVDAVALLTRPGAGAVGGSEGYPTVQLETMMAGIPLIARADRISTLPVEGVCDPNDFGTDEVDAVAHWLDRLRQPAERARYGAVLRPLVEQHPTAADCARLLWDALTEAVAVRQGNPR